MRIRETGEVRPKFGTRPVNAAGGFFHGSETMPAYDRKALAPEILRRIAEGESLRAICRDEGMPAASTFNGWTNEDAELAEQYARATASRADVVFDEIFEIADNPSGDVQRDRLRVDTRKWALARMNSKKYGDKVETTISGGKDPVLVKFVDFHRDLD